MNTYTNEGRFGFGLYELVYGGVCFCFNVVGVYSLSFSLVSFCHLLRSWSIEYKSNMRLVLACISELFNDALSRRWNFDR